MISRITAFTENFLFKCWWLILFCLLCGLLYEQGRKKIDLEYKKLYNEYVQLQAIKKNKLEIQEELMLKINSQSDPDFVELLLRKELGVVPEGQTKFFFGIEND